MTASDTVIAVDTAEAAGCHAGEDGMREQQKAKQEDAAREKMHSLAAVEFYSFDHFQADLEKGLHELEAGMTRMQKARLFADRMSGGSTCSSHLSNCARVSVPELLSRLHTPNRSMKCTSPSPVAALNASSGSITGGDHTPDHAPVAYTGGFNPGVKSRRGQFAGPPCESRLLQRAESESVMLPGFYESHFARPQIGRAGRAVVAGETKLYDEASGQSKWASAEEVGRAHA